MVFENLVQLLPSDSILVLNQSRVQKARLLGQKETGGKAEVFIVEYDGKMGRGLVKCRGTKRVGDRFLFGPFVAVISKVMEGEFILSFNQNVKEILDTHGKLPIPPYIRNGESDEADHKDYQTVFAKEEGSVAAPTAGLHFTPEVLKKLEDKGIEIVFVTLHVGLGTFSPIKNEKITEHKMHSERFFITSSDVQKLNAAKENQKKIIAVGTTSLRTLESIYNHQTNRFDFDGSDFKQTDIFLHPGVEVGSIDGLVTNFHLPKSSLLMLVSSLIGREKCLELYQQAIKKEYRFFSYGDAMFISRFSCIN